MVRGDASPTSDLDITVLLDGPPAPMRKSLVYGGWPVELFVHTEKSLAYFSGKDQERRQPTDDAARRRVRRTAGHRWVRCAPPRELPRGGGGRAYPLNTAELDLLRYTITNLLDDLSDASGDERTAIASVLWQDAARLLLTGARHWSGTGKGLLREVVAYDSTHDTDHARALMQGVRADDDSLVEEVDRILAVYGGRLFAGFELAATPESG